MNAVGGVGTDRGTAAKKNNVCTQGGVEVDYSVLYTSFIGWHLSRRLNAV